MIDHGRIIADGTGDELKAAAGGVTVEILLADPHRVDAACAALTRAGLAARGVHAAHADLEVPTELGHGLETVQRVAGALEAAGVAVNDLGLRRASLDEVFLQLTERPAAAPTPEPATADAPALNDEATR